MSLSLNIRRTANTQCTSNIRRTALLTALHLLVDGLCACSVLMLQGSLTGVGVAVLFVGYNVLAFMTQPFVGMWMDRRRPGPMCLVAAAMLLLSGALLATVYPCCTTTVPLLASIAILLGMGNSLFHVWGGKAVTEHTANDPRHLGVFVSSGALGLALGSMWHTTALMGALAVALMGAVALFQRSVCVCDAVSSPASPSVVPCDWSQGKSGAVPGLLLFMLLLVFGRSFIGNMKPGSVESIGYFAAMASVLAFVGKASGGFIAKRVGVWTTLTTALMASGVCLLLSGSHWMFAALMVLCINITMPLTLHLANRSLPQRAGLAFGALAFMLIPGHALGLYLSGSIVVFHLLYALVATIIIEALVLFALHERRWKVFAASVAMNVLTNLPLNLAVRFVPALQQSTLLTQIILESVVTVVEFLLFFAVTRQRRTAAIYAVACNVTSYLCGLLFGAVLYMFQ